MNYAALRAAGAALLFLHGTQALASGYVLPRATAEALGMADANVALARGAGAQFINPAGLAEPDTGGVAGLLAGRISISFTRPGPAGAAAAGEHDAKPEYPLLPVAAAGFRAGSLALGLSLDVSHGTSVEWPDHTWDVAAGPFQVDLSTKAALSVVRLGPALAWPANDRLSLGARVFAQHVSATEESDLYKVEGDGVSPGYQLGVRYRGDTVIAGAAYTSRTDTKLEGSLTGVHPLVAGTVTAGDATTHILLPDRLQAGVAFQMAPGLWWEVDLDWIGWSYVDELTIREADGSIANAGRNARHNEDTLSYRTGVKWQARPHVRLYAGLGHDPNPIPDRDVSPTTSMLPKTRLGLGAAYALSGTFELAGAYQFVYGHARTVGESDQDNLGAIDTGVFEGTYESRTHSLGVTLSGRF